MDSFELLKKWPGWGNANAEKVFASPAWRLVTEYNGQECSVRKVDDLSDLLWIDVEFDGIPHCMGLADSDSYPDLHLLWAKRNGLPAEVLLALVEKECGELFQTLENAARKSLDVKGVSPVPPETETVASLGVFAEDADQASVTFSLTLSPALTMAWGQLKFIDTTHPEIRSLTVEATPFYSAADLPDDALESLRTGDSILLSGEEPRWLTEPVPVNAFALVGAEKGQLAFAQLADDALPPVPPPGALRLVRGEVSLAEGVLSTLAGNAVMSVTKIAHEG